MNWHRLTRGAATRLVVPGAVLALGPLCARADFRVAEPGGDIAAGASIVLESDEPYAAADRLAVFVGYQDVSALLRRRDANHWVIDTDSVTLVAGQQDLRVYRIDSRTEWTPLAELSIQVLTPRGLEESNVEGRVGLTLDSRVDAGSNADGFVGETSYNRLSGQFGFSSEARRDGFRAATGWNFTAASYRQQALRFGELGAAAPRLDLSDYLLELELGRAAIGIGHVNFDGPSVLLGGLANRGLTYRHAFGQRFDVGFTTQRGQFVTGYDDLLGLSDSNNYIAALSLATELLPNRAGSVRLEWIYLDAQVPSLPGFNIGEVADAEENDGMAVRLSASSPQGRVNASAEWAESRYVNPPDPFLSQGLDLVPVAVEDKNARSATLSVNAVQGRQVFGDKTASLSFTLNHSRADPLYRSVAAYVAGDRESNGLRVGGNVGIVAFQAEAAQSEDNLDDIATILKTRTRTSRLGYSLPLRGTRADGSQRGWLPSRIDHSYSRVHQLGINLPPSFDPLTHIPDQLTENQSLGVDWRWERVSFGYRIAYGDQDNRQPGRAQADFETLTRGIDLSFPLTRTFDVSIGVARTTADEREQQLERVTDSSNLGVRWQIARRLSLRGRYSLIEEEDSLNVSSRRAWTATSEIDWQFELRAASGRRLPGQLYFRHAAQGTENVNTLFGFASFPRIWTFSAGVTFTPL